MKALSRLRALTRNLLRPAAREQELDEELRAFAEMAVQARIAAGMGEAEARRAVAIEMGKVDTVKEEVRAVRAGAGLESLGRDLALAVRQLRRAPAFAATVVATLALAMGANAAVFSVIRAVLLAPPPYHEPDRLMVIWSNLDLAGYRRAPLSGPELLDLREHARGFQDVGAIWTTTAQISGEGEPEQLRVGLVTANFLSLLGVEPRLGRNFEPAEEGQGAPKVVILSDALWRRRFGADPRVVGRTVRMDGGGVTVIGVAPAGLRLAFAPDANVPPDLQAFAPFLSDHARDPRDQYYLRTVARLAPGVAPEAAAREVAEIGTRLEAEHTEYEASGRSFFAVGLQDDAVRPVRPVLLALMGTVGLLLLLACVNVANLLLGRELARREQMAVRAALGATRGRLVLQVMVETLVLACLGLLAGLAVGQVLLHLLIALRPAALSRIGLENIGLDPPVLAFTGGVGLIAAIVVSLVGLRGAMRPHLEAVLRAGGRSDDDAPRRRLRRALVISQVALGTILLVGAGLLVRSFVALTQVDLGFHAERVLTFRLSLPRGRYRTVAAGTEFARRLEDRLRALPGVEAVGAVSALPYDDLPNWSTSYTYDGVDPKSRGGREADARSVSPGWFETIGAELVAGRGFEESDDEAGPPVVVVDERLAEKAWPGRDAIGQRLQVDFVTDAGFVPTWALVVGVVRHIRHRDLTEVVREQVYVPHRQSPRNPMAWALRTKGKTRVEEATIRRIVAQLDGELPVYDVRPLAAYVGDAQGRARFTMVLSAAFAALALLLAAIGIYGVMSYSVTRRRREIGVRLALGARAGQVRRAVLGDGLLLAGTGLAVGLAGAALLTRTAASLLYAVSPLDPLTYAAVTAALVAVAVLATWAPARRATRFEPIEILRSEN
jgi:putative ABC transport system permease protein